MKNALKKRTHNDMLEAVKERPRAGGQEGDLGLNEEG